MENGRWRQVSNKCWLTKIAGHLLLFGIYCFLWIVWIVLGELHPQAEVVQLCQQIQLCCLRAPPGSGTGDELLTPRWQEEPRPDAATTSCWGGRASTQHARAGDCNSGVCPGPDVLCLRCASSQSCLFSHAQGNIQGLQGKWIAGGTRITNGGSEMYIHAEPRKVSTTGLRWGELFLQSYSDTSAFCGLFVALNYPVCQQWFKGAIQSPTWFWKCTEEKCWLNKCGKINSELQVLAFN